MYALSITQKYPPARYNLLGNTSVVVEVPDIMSQVIQAVQLSPNPDDGDVYIQQKAKNAYNNRPATPDLYAITKNGLKKLADGAGIKMISSEHVIPSTCQKCVAVNQGRGQALQCWNCSNQDVAYRVTVAVPQLTGEVLPVEDTHEIIVKHVTPGMSDKQRSEFMKHLPQICEAKALNGAIRTALHIKGTYTLEEIRKPFVVAYLVPNLNQEDVKRAAIDNMFKSSVTLFGNTPTVHQIEGKVPEVGAIEASDGENYDQYIDDTYRIEEQPPAQELPHPQQRQEPVPVQAQQNQQQAEQMELFNNEPRNDWFCDHCGVQISEKVWRYSVDKFNRPLCYKCQNQRREAR